MSDRRLVEYSRRCVDSSTQMKSRSGWSAWVVKVSQSRSKDVVSVAAVQKAGSRDPFALCSKETQERLSSK